MTTHIELVMDGNDEGIMYVFDKAGEGLMMHDHDYTSAHNILVLKGKVVVYGDMPAVVMAPGLEYPIDWSRQHEVIALEDGTAIFNRLLNGVPSEFRTLPLDKRRGSMDDTLHNPIPYHTALTR
jgi:hypothetical protein